MTRVSLGYGVLIGMLLGGLTSAEAIRCGQRIIALGYTKAEVVDRCGEHETYYTIQSNYPGTPIVAKHGAFSL